MNAVIYARYSPGPRQTDQSIEGQVRDCMSYAEANNITVIKVYADRHISGSDFVRRTEFTQMIRDAEKGQFEAVIVWKIDRFGRNREEIALNKIRLKKNGIRLLYAKESIPEGPEGIILESLMEGLAEYYIADLRQKVKRGQRESALKGYAVTGKAAYGYNIKDKRYVENKEESWVVRYVFEHINAGESATSILKQLSALGVRNRKGDPLSKNWIYTMLRNRKYIGECFYDNIPIPVPALIEQELWDSVQAKIKRAPKQSAAYKAPVRYLLSCKAYCGECGALMVGESGHGSHGTVYHYYKCSNRKRQSGPKKCNSRTYRKDDFEAFIVGCTIKDVLKDDVIDCIANEVVKIYERSEQSQKLKSLQSALQESQRNLKNVMRAIESGILTSTTKDRLTELECQIEEYKTLIAREKLKKATITADHVKYWLSMFKAGDIHDNAFRQQLIDVFVHSVYIYNDKVVIAYNYADNDHSVAFDPKIFHCSDTNAKVRHRGFEPRTT